MVISKLKLDHSYSIDIIDDYAEENNFEVEEDGVYRVGESFLVLNHTEKDIVISAVLVAEQGNVGIYRIIYSDIK